MTILLSEHFDTKKLIRFTFPSIIMMVFTSIYGVVDGLFASNIVGTTAFAGINMILPFLTILGALDFIFLEPISIVLGGGGVLNWSFLQAGLCDELSLVVTPTADSSAKTPALFTALGKPDENHPSFL